MLIIKFWLRVSTNLLIQLLLFSSWQIMVRFLFVILLVFYHIILLLEIFIIWLISISWLSTLVLFLYNVFLSLIITIFNDRFTSSCKPIFNNTFSFIFNGSLRYLFLFIVSYSTILLLPIFTCTYLICLDFKILILIFKCDY